MEVVSALAIASGQVPKVQVVPVAGAKKGNQMSALIPDAVVDLLERMNLDARHVEWLRERPRHGPRAFAEFVQRIYIKPEWITKMVGATAKALEDALRQSHPELFEEDK